MRTILLSHAKAGDEIASPVMNDRGMVILPQGTKLSMPLIDRMIRMGVVEVIVASEDVLSLSARLEAQFEEHLESVKYQPLYDLDFVPSEKAFHLFHNCNKAVANWLRELGCDVRGAAVFASFVVK